MGKIKDTFMDSYEDDDFDDPMLKRLRKSINSLEQARHKIFAKDKIWETRNGDHIPYNQLQDDHLDSILRLFEEGKFKNRLCQLKDLQREKLKRTTKNGKILYEK